MLAYLSDCPETTSYSKAGRVAKKFIIQIENYMNQNLSINSVNSPVADPDVQKSELFTQTDMLQRRTT